jgi:formylglycine-generating enzyme required for sulfatase activity
MCGNVWELCENLGNDYETSTITIPRDTTSGETRIIRGGSYRSKNNSSLIFIKLAYPESGYSEIGFRLVLSSK